MARILTKSADRKAVLFIFLYSAFFAAVILSVIFFPSQERIDAKEKSIACAKQTPMSDDCAGFIRMMSGQLDYK